MNKTILRPQSVWHATAALFGGFLLFFLVIGVGMTALHTQYQDRVFPGVNVGRVNVGGETPQGAASLLAEKYAYPQKGTILLQYEDRDWFATPAELGLFFSHNHNAEVAFEYGREGSLGERLLSQIQIMRYGVTLTPRFVIDERVGYQYLSGVAEEINKPAVEASLRLDGLDVVIQPGQIGRKLDIPATLQAVEAQVKSLEDGVVPLVVDEEPPDILDISAEAEFARQILSQPLTLTVPDPAESDPGPWVLEPEILVQMLSIERVSEGDQGTYRIALDPENLEGYLEGVAGKVEQAPRNARMIFNDDTRELDLLEREVVGRRLDIEKTIRAIQEGLKEDRHQIPVVLEYTRPPVTEATTAEELGITELVSQESTYFRFSSAARIQNIKTAAAQFHGIFIAPGETFSMGEQLGDVSLDKGYEEAWIIYGDRTIKGVGGGVCQVSTTLFRTVFFGGYPVVERHPHAYRVKYYEQTAVGYKDRLAGLDATVYFPVVDFKFKNDTDHWLLMETYVNVGAKRLTWKFYSTRVGRTVKWDTSGLTEVKDPPDPIYEKNEDLAKGKIKQVDWSAKGATVTILREVFQDGELAWREYFQTKYMPWAAVCQYGPGTKGMPPEDPDPENPCKPDT
ncbi:MAG: VanW family protein [Anaerolineales bacterium]|nr:VanW family protein [Anaerolineales bacterium]